MINIAFVCHCDKTHGKINVKSKGGEDISIQYIDPGDGCKKWSDVEDDSIDIMYTINCPLYYPYFDGKFNKNMYPSSYKELYEEDKDWAKSFFEELHSKGIYDIKDIKDALFIDGFSKLKLGGKIVIPFSTKIHESYQNFLTFVRDKYPQTEFDFEITEQVPYDYFIEWNSFHSGEENYVTQSAKDIFKGPEVTKFLVITKISSEDKFQQDLLLLGKDKFLQRFLTKQQFKSRMISKIELDLLIKKIQRVYPKASKQAIISLFSKNPTSLHRSLY
jgi:hypothetical protein